MFTLACAHLFAITSPPPPLPPHRLEIFAVEIQPLLQITFVIEKKRRKSLLLAPPIAFGEEAKCYLAEFHWQFLVRGPPPPPHTHIPGKVLENKRRATKFQ